MSKEAILARIKKIPVDVRYDTPDPVGLIKDHDESGLDLVEEYITRAIENKAFVMKSSDLIKDINEIIAKEGAKNLIYPANLPIDINAVEIASKFAFDKPVEEFKDRLFDYDISIIKARKAASSHGVFCVTSSKEQPRLLSLTPRVCVVLLKKEDILKSVADVLNEIKKQDEKLPTNIVFICGPSRTSDIELTPVLGVHGSQIVYILVH